MTDSTRDHAPEKSCVKVRVDDVTLSDDTPSFVGDIVKVLPRRAGGRDGYLAVVRRIEQTRHQTEITVAGIAVASAAQAVRTYSPDRLRRPSSAELRTVALR